MSKEEIRELVMKYIDTGYKYALRLGEVIEREISEEERIRDHKAVVGPLLIYDTFLDTIASIYNIAKQKNDEEIKRKALESLKELIHYVHTPLAVLGSVKYEENFRVPLRGTVPSLDRFTYVPIVSLTIKEPSAKFGEAEEEEGPRASYRFIVYTGKEEEPVEIIEITEDELDEESDRYSELIADLIYSQAIPVGGLIKNKGVSMYEIIRDLLIPSKKIEEKVWKGLVEPIKEQRRRYGKAYIIPITLAHSIPREAIAYELMDKRGELNERKPITRAVMFKPEVSKEPEEDTGLIGSWDQAETFSELIRNICEVFRNLKVKIPKDKTEVPEYILKFGKTITFSHISLSYLKEPKLSFEFPRIPLDELEYLCEDVDKLKEKIERAVKEHKPEKTISVDILEDILANTEPREHLIAILIGCLGAAGVPMIGEFGISGADLTISVTLAFAARGYKYVIGTIREAIDSYFSEFYAKLIKKFASGIPLDEAFTEIRKEKYENYRKEKGKKGVATDTLRPIAVLYEIVEE